MDDPQTDQDWHSLIEKTIALRLPESPYTHMTASFLMLHGTHSLPASELSDSPTVTATSLSPAKLASYIDHTLLALDASETQLERLCEQALDNKFRTVCVRANWVPYCRHLLDNRVLSYTPGVAAVVGFHEGKDPTKEKCNEAHFAIFHGASELDMVMNYELLQAGRLTKVYEDIKAVKDVTREPRSWKDDTRTASRDKHLTTNQVSIMLKVILETSQLTKEQIVAGSIIAIRAGADFIKTSTGFRGGGASLHDVRLMKSMCSTVPAGIAGESQGPKVKASGGIRTIDDCLNMINAGADRIGASSGVKILAGLKALQNGTKADGQDVPSTKKSADGGHLVPMGDNLY